MQKILLLYNAPLRLIPFLSKDPRVQSLAYAYILFYLLTYAIILTRIWNLSQYWELYEGNLDKTYVLNFTELLCSTAKLLMGIV